MDSKALAKSKRAHSQHHTKKYHSNQKAKPPAGGAKGKHIPTNWDRYEEEFDLGSEGGASDIVLPKSKGADYSHLIAEAQSQSQSQFDDVLSGEWNKGIGSMLSARGDSILSWIGDDNFVVDDKTAPNHEVSFLSLNLHSLAEQLDKVDLSQRLYIEADLLPPELNVEGLESTSSQSADQVEATLVNKGARVISKESTCGEFPDKSDVADQDIEIMISNSPDIDCLDPNLSNVGSISVNQVDVDLSKLEKSTNQRKPPESSVKPLAGVPNKNVATFKAATAEEELDMLLDSFSETKINDSSGFRFVQEEASVPPLQLPRKGTDSSKLMAANLDDALDDLINEISIPINQSGPSHPQEKMAVHDFESSSRTMSKSKELDDFDSWLDTV
ncbi:protein ECERIFERUM 16 [Rosa rugosa]|uniref:protein ECERIFERUM 16 n=1 Tax=Rosa rugosa TaxID=74645 RepID=UPI002B405759|nr:protein ECERIFERUM 16 [Rosa rugosa]